MIIKVKQLIQSIIPPGNYISPFANTLNNHVVIITGGCRNVGKAIAESLYKEGASLALVSRNDTNFNNFLNFDPKRILLIKANCINKEDVNRVVNLTIDKYGKVNTLINCARKFINKPFVNTSINDYNLVIDNNLKSAFLMSSAVVPVFKKHKGGLIINIGSKISHNTNITPNKVLYATAKYAIEGFSFALNKELKPYGVRVTCLMPATINTFLSLNSKNYLSAYDISSVALMLIKFKNIDFEGIIFKSIKHDI